MLFIYSRYLDSTPRTSMRNVSYIHTYVHETRRTFYKDTHTSDTRTRTHACTHMSARANTLTHTLHTSYYTEIYIYMRAYYAFTHMLRFVYINIHIPFLVFHLRTLYIRKFVSISRRNTFERRFVWSLRYCICKWEKNMNSKCMWISTNNIFSSCNLNNCN